MPMGKIRIDKITGFAYIPKDIRKEGFEGDIDTLPNALTLTLIKPGVPLKSAIKSLRIILKDLELRVEHEEFIESEKEQSKDVKAAI